MQSPDNREFDLRPMREDDVNALVGWAIAEGLNPGLNDAACFARIDPDGFFMGLLDEEPIGGIAAVRLSDEDGLIVWSIIREPYRGQGYGKQLWRTAMEHLGDRCVALEALATQEKTLRETGFTVCSRQRRYRAVAGGEGRGEATPLEADDLAAVADYDQAATGGSRRAVLECWLGQAGSLGVGLGSGDSLRGYGLRRRAAEGYLVGPVIADDPDAAGAVVQALIADLSEGPIFLDLPVDGPEVDGLVDRFGLIDEFETLRLCSDAGRCGGRDKIFATPGLVVG